MFKIGRLPLVVLALAAAAFYAWKFAFSGNEWMVSLGVNLLQVAAGILSFVWLFKAYRSQEGKRKNFWLLLSIGTVVYLSSNLLFLFIQISQKTDVATDLSYLIWVIAYFFFLAALIYRTKELNTSLSKNSYVFNIVIFMVTAVAISTHYLINPVLALSNNSWLNTAFTLAYPIADLSILFVIALLYYLIQHNKENNLMLYVIAGFFLQITADSFYVYLSINEGYYAGSIIDLLWLFALLSIGFAGYYAKDSKEKTTSPVNIQPEIKEYLLPYISILMLLGFAAFSYQWDFNALSLAVLITFFMVIGRQLIILRKNDSLMKEFKFLAYHDPLTDLKNRVSFMEEIEGILEKNRKSKVAVLLIDLDRFKVINDTLGHYIGDQILLKASARLKSLLNDSASLYRIGGDEFVIVIPEAAETECSDAAEAILDHFRKPFIVNDYEINVTSSIGISIFPENGKNSEDLLKNADAAMYLSKSNGKNGFSFYDMELNKTMARKLAIETELRKALEKNQFALFYQPKIDLQTKKMIGMEALLRWQHPELGFISPMEFIPVAEETGQIIPIGEWVLKEACRQNKLWQEKGHSPLCVSVNVSVLQFQHGEFLKTVRKALKETGLAPEYLELEITESIMQNIKESIEILENLREMDVKISIDDFGTGYSSLHVLQKLPIDTLKIDKSFIDNMVDNNQYSMVKTIIDMGLNLNLNVVAEGIENTCQMDILIENKCDIGQGYLFQNL